MVFAAAQRCLPASVFGPRLLPPCIAQTRFPLVAGDLHCCFVRFDDAWHRGQVILPPRVEMQGCFSQELMDGGTLSQTEYLNNWHIWRKCGTFWGLQLVGFGSYPVFPDIQLFQLSSYLVFCVWVEFHIRAGCGLACGSSICAPVQKSPLCVYRGPSARWHYSCHSTRAPSERFSTC